MIESRSVNDQIRKAIKIELVKKGLSQIEISEKIGVTPQHLSRMLSEGSKSKSGDLPKAWQNLLDELGLDLIVKPRGN